jgi:hypothetical protein
VNRRIALFFGAWCLGFLVMFVATVRDEPGITGFALAWTLAVLVVGRHVLRCPLCKGSVLDSPVSASLRWVSGRERRCWRCRTDYEEAVAAIAHRNRAAGSDG